MPPCSLTQRLCVFFLLACLSAGSGCAGLAVGGRLPLLGGDEESPPDESTAFCTVELRGDSGKTKRVQLPITEETRVTDVLQQSGATTAFRRMDAYILRRAPHSSHEMVKLEVRFDRESRQVKWETDYAIHPDDRIVVSKSTITVFEEAYNAILGPILGNLGR